MKRPILKAVIATVLLVFSLLINTNYSYSQTPIRCYSTEYDSIRHANNPDLQTNEEFEAWMSKMINERKQQLQQSMIINGVYQIPVVVHVIRTNNGDSPGTGDNLSQAAIQSQIDVLNEDFRKMFGTNGWNTHPNGADTEIEFCLARRRPDGSAFPGGEDGINRVWWDDIPGLTAAPPYATGIIDGTIKPWSTGTQLGGWDPAVYMNFWVVQISGGILGYAQFPTTVLGGMGCGGGGPTSTDGVVMTTSSIGKSAVTGFPGPYNEGRTATHEIGHWLGLRHIWGDGGCTVDDYCADTPLSDAANFGCPVTNSCADPAPDPNDMVENYMDYTDDLCMNIFTEDQKMRMRIVLENSPIRASLITSDACIPPATDDASIVNILNPFGDNCPGSIAPTVTIRNRGSNTLTSATIEYTIDNGTPVSFAWSGSVASGAETNVALPAFTTQLGIHTIKAYSVLPNGFTDPDPTYDTTELQFAVSNGYQPNYAQDFDAGTFPPDVRWSVVNPNSDCYEWVGQSCTSSSGAALNNAAMMPNYNNGTNQDEYLYTPIFILPCNATSAQLTFDKAYRKRINSSNDRLRVEMSLDCGSTWATTLYDQSGNGLVSVTGNFNGYWIPSAAGDWDNIALDLTPYVTGASQNMMFRFRGTNAGNGGNLYVDNVNVNAVTPGEIEVSVSGVNVLDGGYYNYGSQPVGTPVTAVFTVDNPGTTDLILTPPISIVGDVEFTLNSSFGVTTVPGGGSTTFSIDFTASGPGPFTATVSFGTNDCDEGTYDFIITGTGNTTPPVASFTATPVVICEGNTVTYEDASTGATSWSWTFPGGTPATATGVGPHTITYNTAGTYNAQLDVTNSFGSDSDLQTSLVTVLPGTGTATLPVAEGFVSPTFPPTNWTINNGGNQSVTWVRSGTQGTAPTAGNSAYINLYTTNTSGDQDDLELEPADFSSFVSAQLTFDVAYARYDATYFDQLDVLVSTDCGQSYTTVYSKSGSTLATDPDQTAAYTAPATWRNEVVDLTPYVGNSKVEVLFRSVSGWGQYLYIDNVNLSGVVSSVIADFSASPNPVCVGANVTFTDASTGASTWDWDFGAGATPATATGAGPHIVTYATSGIKTITLSVDGGVDVSTQNITVNPLDDASFSYTAATYCDSESNPTPTITGLGGGSFTSAPAGLSLNGSTGEIDLATSTPGLYTITYSTNGTCPNSSDVTVEVFASPAAPTISAGGLTTFCAGGSVDLTSSQPSGNSWSTTETTQTITVSSTGSYTVSYTDGNGCSATSLPTVVTVNALPSAPTITASGPTTFCAGGSVTLTSSQPSGNVWSTAETTSAITVASSGSYTVTYTDGNGCSATSSALPVTVNPLPSTPTISPSGATTFCAGGSVTLTSSQASGNTWSTSQTTQSILVTTSGSYTVSYTDGNGCSATSAPTIVTVNPLPSTPTISASGATTFCTGGSVTLTSSSASNNLWSTSETTQSIVVSSSGSYSVTYTDGNGCSASSAATTVTVNPLPSTPTISTSGATTFCAGSSVTLTSSQGAGNVWSTGSTSSSIVVTNSGSYTVTYTDGNGCSATSAATTVTVNPAPTIALGTISNPSACLTATGSIQVTGSGTGVVYWTGTSSGNSGTVSLPYTISGLFSGPYSIYYIDGTGCTSNTINQSLTDPAGAPAPTITPSGPITFCSGGSVDLTSSYASSNVWSTSETTQTITVTTSGTYTVTYVDGFGCSSTSAPLIVTVNANPTAPSITPLGSTTFCDGSSVNLSSSEGSGNVWSTTETTQTINVTAAGSYTVTYTDGNGCSATSAPISITVNALPATPTISASGPIAFCAGGSVDLTSSQASGNTWSTSETTQTITVSASGNYTVTYTDGNGCSSTSASTSVTVNPLPSAPTISASGPTTFCAGGSVDLTSSQVSGNLWSTSETTQTITVSSAGSYSVTYTDGNGCSASSVVTTVTVTPLPTIATGNITDPLTCSATNGSIVITGSGIGVVSWTGTATGNSGTVTLPYTISGLGAGTYDITFNNGCISNTVSASLSDPTAPAAPIVTVVDDCGSSVLTATGINLQWSTSETTSSITVTTAGTYTVTQTVGGCTSAPGSGIANPLTVPSAPVVSVNDTCGSSVLSATGSNLLWSTSETTATITVTSGGSYTVTQTVGGCESAPGTGIANPYATPSAPSITANGPTTFCEGGSVDLSSSQATGNSWSTSETTQTITVVSTGSYSVTYTDGNGCSATSSTMAVTVNPLPVVTLGAISDACLQDAAFTLSGGSPAGGTYSGPGVSGGNFDPSVAGVGGHTVTYTYTDGNGCTDSAQVTLSVKDCAGIEDLLVDQFAIYPNPTSAYLNIESLNGLVKGIKMYDSAGRLIIDRSVNEEKILIDMTEIAPGVYNLLIEGEQGNSITRVTRY